MATRRRDYAAEYAARERRAVESGYEGGYREQRAKRKEASEILEGRKPWIGNKRIKADPRAEKDLIRAWTQGKLMGIARKQGNKTGVAYHRRQMDAALLDVQIRSPGFSVEEDFFYH